MHHHISKRTSHTTSHTNTTTTRPSRTPSHTHTHNYIYYKTIQHNITHTTTTTTRPYHTLSHTTTMTRHTTYREPLISNEKFPMFSTCSDVNTTSRRVRKVSVFFICIIMSPSHEVRPYDTSHLIQASHHHKLSESVLIFFGLIAVKKIQNFMKSHKQLNQAFRDSQTNKLCKATIINMRTVKEPNNWRQRKQWETHYVWRGSADSRNSHQHWDVICHPRKHPEGLWMNEWIQRGAWQCACVCQEMVSHQQIILTFTISLTEEDDHLITSTSRIPWNHSNKNHILHTFTNGHVRRFLHLSHGVRLVHTWHLNDVTVLSNGTIACWLGVAPARESCYDWQWFKLFRVLVMKIRMHVGIDKHVARMTPS